MAAQSKFALDIRILLFYPKPLIFSCFLREHFLSFGDALWTENSTEKFITMDLERKALPDAGNLPNFWWKNTVCGSVYGRCSSHLARQAWECGHFRRQRAFGEAVMRLMPASTSGKASLCYFLLCMAQALYLCVSNIFFGSGLPSYVNAPLSFFAFLAAWLLLYIFKIHKLILIHIVVSMLYTITLLEEFLSGTVSNSVFFFICRNLEADTYFTIIFICALFSCWFNKLNKKCFFVIFIVMLLLNISGNLFLRWQGLIFYPAIFGIVLYCMYLHNIIHYIFNFFFS